MVLKFCIKSALESTSGKKENQPYRKRKAAAQEAMRKDTENKNVKVYETSNFDLETVSVSPSTW